MKVRPFLLLAVSGAFLLLSCGNTNSSSSASQSIESSSSADSSGETSLDSTESSSSHPKRDQAQAELATIKEYQEADDFTFPTTYSGAGTASLFSASGEITFDYSSDDEYFHVQGSIGTLSVDNWIYTAEIRSSGWGGKTQTYLIAASSLTKRYTKTSYTSTIFKETVEASLYYKAVAAIAKECSSYKIGDDMLNELGDTYAEDNIVRENYSFGNEGTLSSEIRINDGDENIFTEKFSYSDYLGESYSRKGTQKGQAVDTYSTISWDYCDVSSEPDLNEYTINP